MVEALQQEIPLIFLTFSADQGLNASFLLKRKLGILSPKMSLMGGLLGMPWPIH